MVFAIHIQVFGAVQGVFFRANTQAMASKLNLVGWVTNKKDGSVEILAEGSRSSLEKLLEWCYHGPENAHVKELEFAWVEPKNNSKEFSVIR
ncbi:Acylphosphatase [Candidatus Bilamarchaeum dharawalense]|uniref:acylphosphatase n=1 Tax=Candidatus Bilamarchaeum dharawalense TaxID=2885759 RepID=A0A5E4LSS8_9ARCH|nr:Acylphosphatase [Candidatus Bilamarchaeum dharawalense]